MRPHVLKINALDIKGNEHTTDKFIEDVFQEAKEATEFPTFLKSLQQGRQRLQALDIFDLVDVNVTRSADDTPYEWDIHVEVEEKTRKTLGVFGMFGGSTIEGSLRSQLRNPQGIGDDFSFHTSAGLDGSQEATIEYKVPFYRNDWFPDHPLAFSSAFKTSRTNHEMVSSFSNRTHLLSAEASLPTMWLSPSLTVSTALRHPFPRLHPSSIHPLRTPDPTVVAIMPGADKQLQAIKEAETKPYVCDASHDLLRELVPSSKTSLTFALNHDKRNDRLHPSSGYLLKGESELALPFVGDTSFLKSSFSSQVHFPFHLPSLSAKKDQEATKNEQGEQHEVTPFPLSISLSTQVGSLLPLFSHLESVNSFPSKKDSHISDRFFGSVRGFEHDSLGPQSLPLDEGRTKSDALGGLSSFSSTLALNVPLSTPETVFDRPDVVGSLFLSTGSVGERPLVSSLGSWLQSVIPSAFGSVPSKTKPFDLLSSLRVSAGVSLAMRTGLGRLELSYGVPIRFQTITDASSSSTKDPYEDPFKHFQFRVGFTYEG